MNCDYNYDNLDMGERINLFSQWQGFIADNAKYAAEGLDVSLVTGNVADICQWLAVSWCSSDEGGIDFHIMSSEERAQFEFIVRKYLAERTYAVVAIDKTEAGKFDEDIWAMAAGADVVAEFTDYDEACEWAEAHRDAFYVESKRIEVCIERDGHYLSAH